MLEAYQTPEKRNAGRRTSPICLSLSELSLRQLWKTSGLGFAATSSLYSVASPRWGRSGSARCRQGTCQEARTAWHSLLRDIMWVSFRNGDQFFSQIRNSGFWYSEAECIPGATADMFCSRRTAADAKSYIPATLAVRTYHLTTCPAALLLPSWRSGDTSTALYRINDPFLFFWRFFRKVKWSV